MNTFHRYINLPDNCKNGILAIGNFDGIHKGHQKLLNMAKSIAKEQRKSFNVLTFEPHPLQVFGKVDNSFRLTPIRSKVRLLNEFGVDNLIIIHFTPDFYNKTPQQFITDILVQNLCVSTVVVGNDYHFGKSRKGDINTLKQQGKNHNFNVLMVDDVLNDVGERYSSSICRLLLNLGEIERLNDILGHPWEFEGRVVKGKKLGTKMGSPTVNLNTFNYAMPRMGVYAALIGIPNHDNAIKWHQGVMNYGVRPTTDDSNPILEAHILDFSDDIYGQRIIIRPVTFLRPEIKFSNLKDLQQCIYKDTLKARVILQNYTNNKFTHPKQENTNE